MPAKRPYNQMPRLLKRQALFAGGMSVFASLIYFAENFPFPRVIAGVALAQGLCYLGYYLLFDRLEKKLRREAGILLSVIGVTGLTLAVHFTGGIVSPFICFYFCILVSESLYGLENPFTLPLSLAGYLLVVAGQFSGLLPHYNSWAGQVYSSPLAASLIAVVTAFYLVLTRRMTRLIITNLRAKIEREGTEKEVLLRKFSELNSTTQLGVLAHRIVHDLRGPLACISGYIQCELAKEKNAEDLEILKDLDETVSGMAESLHGITRFGKAGGPAPERILLSEFMRNMLAIAAFSPQAAGITFETLYPESLAVSVNASRADLQQAYFNLLKNAMEAVRGNPGSKKIEIVIKLEGAEAKVAISDNGPGVPAEMLKKLLNKSVTTKADGTGVGLLITRDLLVRNGGDVKIFNRGEGGLSVVSSMPAA